MITIINQSTSVYLTFQVLNNKNGRPDDALQLDVETIESPGVDGARFRGRGRRWRDWECEALSGMADYAEALNWAQLVETWKGDPLTVSVRIPGTGNWRQYPNVRLLDVVASASAGPLLTNNWTYGAHIAARFTMRLTQTYRPS